MKKNIFLLLVVFVLWGISTVSAQECNFPKSKITADEILSKVDECQKARNQGTTNAIEDFSCPAGEFALKDNLKLSDERLSYHIAVNLLMNEADENIKKYMQALQKNRNKDGLAWTENLNACIYGSGKSQSKSVRDIYTDICNFGNMMMFLNNNSDGRVVLGTTDFIPQSACQDLANRKTKAWMTLGTSLMKSGIHKSFQNDRNRFMDTIQWKYRAILEKFHDYQKIIFRAASKVGPYVRDTVK